MNKITKWVLILVGSGAVITMVVGLVAFGFYSQAKATEAVSAPFDLATSNLWDQRGFQDGQAGWQEALANALGISVEALQSAQQKASDAAIQQAVEQGLITQNQADMLILGGHGFDFRFGFGRPGKAGQVANIDFDALLAKELNITVDKLQAARDKAQEDLLAQAVANGTLTQEQADLIKARQALRGYLDPNTLLATALGITPQQLQEYRDQGLNLSQILDKVGMTAIEVRDAEQTAYKAAIQKAVTDGVITQVQADLFLKNGLRARGGFGGFPGPGFQNNFGRNNHGFNFGPRPNPEISPTAIPGGGL